MLELTITLILGIAMGMGYMYFSAHNSLRKDPDYWIRWIEEHRK